MGEYDDILHLPRHVSNRHPHMKNADRAKQFVPFAALKGYDEAIQEKQVLYVPRQELSEDDRTALDEKLFRLQALLRQGARPVLSLEYFVPKERNMLDYIPLGQYHEATGPVTKLSLEMRTLRLDGRDYSLDDITALWDPRPDASVFQEPERY